MRLLNAEWSSLTRPDRLRALAEQHLGLSTLKAKQIVKLEEIGTQGSGRTRDQARGRRAPTRSAPSSTRCSSHDQTPPQTACPKTKRPRRLAGQNRIRLIGICFGVAFLAIAGAAHQADAVSRSSTRDAQRIAVEDRLPRPDIVDRNGVLLATDVAVASLYADPSKIIDIDEAIELLTATVPDLDAKELRRKLTTVQALRLAEAPGVARGARRGLQSRHSRRGLCERAPPRLSARAGSARMWWAMSTSTPRASPASRNISTGRARSIPPRWPSPPSAGRSPRRCRSTSACRRR